MYLLLSCFSFKIINSFILYLLERTIYAEGIVYSWHNVKERREEEEEEEEEKITPHHRHHREIWTLTDTQIESRLIENRANIRHNKFPVKGKKKRKERGKKAVKWCAIRSLTRFHIGIRADRSQIL